MIGSKEKPFISHEISGRIQSASMVNNRVQPKTGERFAGEHGKVFLCFVITPPAYIQPRCKIGKNPTRVSNKHLGCQGNAVALRTI